MKWPWPNWYPWPSWWPWWPNNSPLTQEDWDALVEAAAVQFAESRGYSYPAAVEIVALARKNAPLTGGWIGQDALVKEIRRLANIWPLMVAHGLARCAALRKAVR